MSTVTDQRPPLHANREFWLLWLGQANFRLGSTSLLYGVAWNLPFLTDMVRYLVSYLTITAIRVPLQQPRQQPQEHRAPLWRRLFDGLRWIFLEPFLRASTLYVTSLVFVSAPLALTGIVRANAHHANVTEIGVIFGLSGVGGVVGALIAPLIQQRWPSGAVLLAIGALCGVATLLLTTTTHPILLGAILATVGFVTPPMNTIIVSYQMQVTPDRLQGQAYAAMILIAGSSLPLGSLTGGFLLTALGSTGTLLVLTVLTITVV
jgi:predicted MFS family arabinose efflux permease